jgi:nitroimidazol reductase NimA-like FMN-containing flavoprotein (pyridoxamine 5'-phosphate oxidase superfamily)
MSLQMTRAERESFLAGVHVGIISIEEPGRGPLAAPIWYGYEPGGELVFVTEDGSRKGRLLRGVERFSLCAQTEEPPYKYVSVEGPIASIAPADVERDIRPMAHRYLGAELGDGYIEATGGTDARAESIVVRMRPERWLTVDYAKEFTAEALSGGA